MVRIRLPLLVVGGALAAAGIASATGLAGGSETINYTYDAKGRLILVQHSGTVNNNVVANYTFDAADNRRNLKVTGAP
jgi:hypothetical protein